MSKKKIQSNKSPDEIREIILKFLYERRKKARSTKTVGVKPKELKSELKKLGLSENEIVDNLDFLIKNRWVLENVKPYTMFVGRRPISSEKTTYELLANGIEFFEKGSKFTSGGNFSGINIQNINNSVVVIGVGNVVQAQFRELYQDLDGVKDKVLLSQFREDEKLNLLADIETIKNQLAKSNPDKSILTKCWERLQVIASIPSVVELFSKVKGLIEPLLR